jgi:rod shape determining protein RodA
VIAFVPAALITLQPDLGSALLFAPATFAMLLCAGARMKHLALVCAVALAAAPATYPLLKPHQKARIEGLVKLVSDPTAEANGINFQSVRAQTLAGAGGWSGVTDPKARALHKYNDLPERWNDMILAVVLTRFGFLGGLGVVGLYALWFLGAIVTAARSTDAFGRLVVVGFSAIMFAQTFINMGMVLGVLPIIGITLPFVSHGGTSLLSVWLMTGLIVSVAMRPPERLARPTFEFDDRPATYGEPIPQPKIAPAPRRRSA